MRFDELTTNPWSALGELVPGVQAHAGRSRTSKRKNEKMGPHRQVTIFILREEAHQVAEREWTGED